MMDEFTWMRLMGGMLGSGLDWVAVIIFFAIAATYFLAPVIGYESGRRHLLALAMYMILIYGFITFLHVVYQYFQMLDQSAAIGGRGRQEQFFLHVHFLFNIVKVALLVVAMLLYVIGLQALRVRRYETREDG